MKPAKCRAVLAAALLAAFLGAGQRRIAMVAPGAAGALPEAAIKAGIHIPQTNRVNSSSTVMTDGGGYRWDIQSSGCIGQGSNNAYGGGLYCQLGGGNFYSGAGGWLNAAGDEVEFGPFAQGQTRLYRRIKVYKDQGLARWLDIFENTSGEDSTVQVAIYTNTNWTISRTVGSGGADGFGDKDWAFITETNTGGGNSPPPLLHIVCDRKSKLRPAVDIQNNQIYVRYSITLKPRQVAILCYFEAQGTSTEGHAKFLSGFQAYKMLRDLSPEARRLLVNFSAGTSFANLELDRSEQGDMITQAGGEPIFGGVANESFTVASAPLGTVRIPAADVTGMIGSPSESGAFHVLLTDGQVVTGRLGPDKLLLKRQGGDLEIPFEKIRQWSYKISESKPYDIPQALPSAMLRTGDRLAFDPAGVKMRLRSLHGTVDLNPADLLAVRMDNPASLHKALFLNGSTLSGIIEDAGLTARFKLSPRDLTIPRDWIRSIDFAAEETGSTLLSRAEMANQDEIMGDLADEKISIGSEFGPVEVKPGVVQQLTVIAGKDNRVIIQTWDGSTIRGQLLQDGIRFEIMPGPTVLLSPARCASITRMQPLPPAETIRRVDALVAQLGAESAKDRQASADELVKLGPTILPLLAKQLNTHDTEVRQKIMDVMEGIGGKSRPPDAPAGGAPFGRFRG